MGAPLCSRAVGAGGNWYWCWPSPGARDSTMSPGRDLGSRRGSGTPCPLLPVRTPEGVGRRSAGGYRIAVEGHRWRPADEQERSRLTRIAVDRGAEPQTVRVISAPLILDGPGRPGAGRSSNRCCAVMVVTRLKDAAAAVSRICGRGSPIPIFAQVRGILTIVGHRCAAAIGSAHGRAFIAVESHPPDPNRPHGGHSSLTARARRAQHGPSLSAPPRLPAASQLSTCPHIPATPDCPYLPAASRAAATPQSAAPAHRVQGRCHTPVGLILTPSPRHPPPLSGPPPMLTGTFHTAGRVSLRPGAFDAVVDSNPVPQRARRPRPRDSAPLRAGCPRLEESVPAHAECPHMPASSRRHGVRWSYPMPRAFR